MLFAVLQIPCKIQADDLAAVTGRGVKFADIFEFARRAATLLAELTLCRLIRILVLFQIACRDLKNRFLIRRAELPHQQHFLFVG